MYLDQGPVDVVDNIIRWNSAGYDGAGLSLSQSSGDISGNAIIENQANRDGAGVYVFESSGVIVNNIIAFNVSEDLSGQVLAPGKGAGICLYDAYPAIDNNIVAYNDAEDLDGGGIWVANFTSGGEIINNTIVGNHAAEDGGGLCITTGTIPAYNNILAYNQAPTGANLRVYDTGALVSGYNLYYVDGGGSGVVGMSAGEADQVAAPGFVNDPADGSPLDDDYHLTEGGMAIDAGDPDSSFDDRDGTRNDLGAFGGPLGDGFEILSMVDLGAWLEE